MPERHRKGGRENKGTVSPELIPCLLCIPRPNQNVDKAVTQVQATTVKRKGVTDRRVHLVERIDSRQTTPLLLRMEAAERMWK